MKVTARKGPPHLITKKVPVVLEFWMEHEGLDPLKALDGDALKKAVRECLEEHLKTRCRVSRVVAK